MSTPESVEVTPGQAIEMLFEELARAEETWRAGRQAEALDSTIRALGLGLQLGPAPTEQGLRSVLQTAREMTALGNSRALNRLGPGMVELVRQVDESGVLRGTPVMQAWAEVVTEVGALIGQMGLALTLPLDRRSGMLDKAHARAALLDDATGGLFALTAWLDDLQRASPI